VPGLPFDLTPEGPVAGTTWHVENEALVITAGPRTDLFLDPARESPTAGADLVRLVGDVSGDFQLTARVEVDFQETFDAGVLFIGAAEQTWAKLCFEYTPQGRPSVVSVVTRGDSDDANADEVSGNRTWLRISRMGRAFAFHASHDGQWWRLIRYFSFGALPDSSALKVGFLAQSPFGAGCTAVFGEIGFGPDTLTQLRDGS
jgi:regulation of enolase protein 1 (concanavalin A-like superfamily)